MTILGCAVFSRAVMRKVTPHTRIFTLIRFLSLDSNHSPFIRRLALTLALALALACACAKSVPRPGTQTKSKSKARQGPPAFTLNNLCDSVIIRRPDCLESGRRRPLASGQWPVTSRSPAQGSRKLLQTPEFGVLHHVNHRSKHIQTAVALLA
jgi:hypothetical protein